MTSLFLKSLASLRLTVGWAVPSTARGSKGKALPLLGVAMLALGGIVPTALATPVIVNVVETGGALDANDTVPAKWTGATWSDHANNEPVIGINTGTPYTVGLFRVAAPAYVDRAHAYTNAAPAVMPPYLIGGEYIMSGNDDRAQNPYLLDVTVSTAVRVYLLVDNRLSDADGSNPPTFDATHMQWVLDQGWVPVKTGLNRTANIALPDEVGCDESADGTINSYYSVYTKIFPAGTFTLRQADNSGQNMYGAVVVPFRELPLVAQVGGNKVGSVTFNSSTGASYSVVGAGNDIWDARDEFTYAYTEYTGDFDVQVRVESLQFNATWSKAGLMARESLSEFGRMAFQRVTPTAGANDLHLAYRTGIDASAGDSGGNHEDGSGTPTYPNSWLRLIRVGNVITGQASPDGTTWTTTSSQDTATWGGGALPKTVFLGLATSRHSGGPTAAAEYRDFNFNYTAPFTLAGASSRGNPNGVRVSFSKPPGAGGLTAANYTLTASGAPRVSVVTGLRFTTANDAPERDPFNFTLEGTVGDPANGPWTLIASNLTGLPTTRGTTAPDVTFANSTPYSSYRLLFPTVRTPGTANSMQIAEVAFLDGGGNDVTAPGDPVIPSSLNSPMPNEVSSKVIDNDVNSKYLNFDKLNTGFTVTPSGGAIPTGATVLSVASGPALRMVQLTTSPLIEGVTYTVTVSGITDTGGGAIAGNTTTFVHGAGYEARRIMVTHNKTADSGYYPNSDAVAQGIGEVVTTGDNPAGFSGVQTNNVFEDPIPDTGGNERFGTRVAGVLNITTSGNYTFYMSSDDVGRLYLSSDDNPANKVQIANEPQWNGRREYIAGGNQGTRGTPPANISTPKALVAGKKYYMELIFNEGGGGNNGSATWLPPGGAAVANGSSPVPEANFALARQLNGNVFNFLGPVQIISQPTNIQVAASSSTSFRVRADGTPGYTYQWRRKGASDPGFTDIAGATGPTYTTPVLTLADNNAQYAVLVANEFSSALSVAAVLTVGFDTTPPTLVSARGLGNPLTFDLVYSEQVNASDAVNLANYSASGGVTLSAAVLQADGRTVRFTCSSLATAGPAKILTVNNVRDVATTPNTILANSTIPIIYADGSVRRHFWKYASGGGTVAAVTGDPRFPNSPDLVTFPTTFEDTQPDTGDAVNESFGVQFLGLISPPVTGNYNFFMSSDDNGSLWLSTDENPANKVLIANEPQWNGHRAWTVLDRRTAAAPENRSSTRFPAGISLQAGRRYYIECIFSEGGGGNNMSVTWQLPGAPIPTDGSDPLQAPFLSPLNIPASITAGEPANVSTFEGRQATFTVHIAGSPILSLQWFRNGVAIPGQTNLSYTTPTLAFPADNGATYYAVLQNSINTVQSRTATLTVQDDTTAPHLVSAEGNSTFDKVTIRFDEPVENGSAVDTFNYSISGGIGVISAAVGGDGTSVVLSLDPLTPLQENTLYTVTVSGVNDRATPPNTIAANSTVQFRSYVLSPGFLLFQAYDTASTPGNAVSLLTSHPNFPNNPRDTAYIKSFNSRAAYPDDSHEQYGGRISGVFVPPVSGNYLFYLASDDASQLFLNPTGIGAAGKVLLTEETGCCNPFAAHASGPQSLVAGQAYYIEGLYKEGGGGDFLQAAAKLDSDPTDPNALLPIGAGSIGIYSAPINATFNFTQQPASVTKFANQTATFTVAATVTGSTNTPSVQWQRSDNGGATWVNIPNATGNSYSKSFLTIAGDNGAKFRAKLTVPGAAALSSVATLTVIPDNQPPKVLSCLGSTTMDKFTVIFDEPLDPGSAQDSFNFSISSPGGPLAISSLNLAADGATLTITTALQNENTDYTITINDVTDIAVPPNTIVPNTTVTCHSFVFSIGLLLFETYNTPASGTAVSLLTSSPNYPNNPRERFYIPTFDTRNAYPDDSHEQFGGRITGLFVPKVTGNYIFYIRSDDASELWFNPTGPAAGGVVKIQEETGCCGAFSGHATAPQALTAGQRYYIMALYKEGGGGDYAQVAVKLDTDTTNPDSLTPIGPGNLGVFANPAGAVLNITLQPVAQSFCQISAGPPNLANESFNAANGGFTVQTPLATEGPWVYDSVRGTWHCDGQGPENSHANTTKLNTPTYSITQAGAVQMTFRHRWSFEYDGTAWDGGNVQMSVNGGAFAIVPLSSFTQNGYNGTVASGSASELHGQPGFINESPGFGSASPYVTSTVNLGTFAPGATIAIQFFAASDSNTKNQTPTWEIDTFTLAQGIVDVSTVTFSSAANASLPGVPNQTIFYQWQRNDGAGFVDVPTANGSNYTFIPKLTDNGACFRVNMFIPGKSTNSQTACLTVTHRNTPPEFSCGPNIGFNQDCGPQSLLWATSIVPDSIHSASGTFTSDFASGVPPGSAIYGNAHVDNGYLHLTDAVNSQVGSLIVNDLLAGAPVASFSINFKALLGQGTAPPADGLSVSVANNLPNAAISEEGDGTGLIVAFDSYDNGGGEAPAIDVKWGGTTIAHTSVASLETGGQFVPVSIVMHADGKLDVSAAGNPVYVGLQTPYAPIAGARYGFGGRTGGLNENNYIDDLTIAAQASDDSSVEAAQQIQFIVSNNNNALFSVQPAISSDGRLTYTPAAHAAGVASVTVVAKDNGGVACGGSDTSQPCVFTITLNCALTARNDGGATRPNTPLVFPISKMLFNDGNPQGNLTTPNGPITLFSVKPTSTNGATISVNSSNVTYTPVAGFTGNDRFTYTISDGLTFGSAEVEMLVVNGTLPSDNQVALVPVPGGGVLLRFAGIPGRTYLVQRATAVLGPWTTVATLVAPAHGIIEYTDPTPPQPSAFYRTATP